MFTISDISWLEKKVKSSDWEHSKALTFDEFSNFLEGLGQTKARPSTIYYLLRKNEIDNITYDDFITFAERNSKLPNKQYNFFNNIFLELDLDHDGLLDIDDIIKLYRIYGVRICKTLAEHHIKKYDADLDGKIDIDETAAMLSAYFNK